MALMSVWLKKRVSTASVLVRNEDIVEGVLATDRFPGEGEAWICRVGLRLADEGLLEELVNFVNILFQLSR